MWVWKTERGGREVLGDEMDTLHGHEQHRIRWAESLHDFCRGCFAVVIVPISSFPQTSASLEDTETKLPRA
jgi:hypothetical protein